MIKGWPSGEELAKSASNAAAFEKRTDPFGFAVGGGRTRLTTTVRFDVPTKAGAHHEVRMANVAPTVTSVVTIEARSNLKRATAIATVAVAISAAVITPTPSGDVRSSSSFPAAVER